jgi:hypothetical protein
LKIVAEPLLYQVQIVVLKNEFVRTGGDMRIAVLVLLMMLSGITRADRPDCGPPEATQQPNSTSVGEQRGQIKINLATSGGPSQPAKDTYRVGERVSVVIAMTNTGNQPVYVCESSPLYQERPQLLKDGKPVQYVSFRQSMMQLAERDKTCDRENLPQQLLLRPNEPTVVDRFTLAEGATSSLDDNGWYEPLGPGKYTLSNQRRLSCCDGPFIETNSISFVVVP